MKHKLNIVIAIIIILIQIYLVSVQPINERMSNKYDDALMIEQAENILNGKWLGEYNCLTLIKGAFTPLFIAVANVIHLPFLLAQDVFYILACILLIYELRTIIKNNVTKLIILIIMIFNPIIYSSELCRTYRDGIYLSLILYLLGFTIGIFLNRKETKKLFLNQIGLGIALSAIYLCREENVWILPYLIVSIIITIIYIVTDKEEQKKKQKIFSYIVPIVIVFIMINSIKFVNYKYYGVFELNQYWGKEFKEAYGALTRILPEKEIKKVPVTSDMLEKAYQVSPKFSEVREYFKENTNYWSVCGDGNIGEIQGGWFHWALMRAAESKGYYKDAKTANEFYKQVAEEINEACESGKIEGLKYKRISNVIRFDFKDICNSIMKMGDTIKFQYKMILLKVKCSKVWTETENIEGINKTEKVTLTKVITQKSYTNSVDKIRIEILGAIKNVYAKVNPYIFYESIIIAASYIIISLMKKRNYEKIIILIGMAGLYLSRIFIITFTSVMMYTGAINVMYLSVTYAIQILFALLVNILFFNDIMKGIKKCNRDETN